MNTETVVWRRERDREKRIYTWLFYSLQDILTYALGCVFVAWKWVRFKCQSNKSNTVDDTYPFQASSQIRLREEHNFSNLILPPNSSPLRAHNLQNRRAPNQMDLRAKVSPQNIILVLEVTSYSTEELRAAHLVWKPFAFSTEQNHNMAGSHRNSSYSYKAVFSFCVCVRTW